MDNYIMLNGKKIELTDEQINLIMSNENDKIGNCFDRVEVGSKYYFIDCDGSVDSMVDSDDDGFVIDTDLYNIANYCTDKKIMEQRALHEILNRLLWRFSMINDGNKINWFDNVKDKFFIYYNYDTHGIKIDSDVYCKSSTVYFYSNEIAQIAINEIIIPFMNEYPEFVW